MNFTNEKDYKEYCDESDIIENYCVSKVKNKTEKELELERFKKLDNLAYKFREDLFAEELLDYILQNNLYQEVTNLKCFNDEFDDSSREFDTRHFRYKNGRVGLLKSIEYRIVVDDFILSNYEQILYELLEIRDYLEYKLKLDLTLNDTDLLDFDRDEKNDFYEYNYYCGDDECINFDY